MMSVVCCSSLEAQLLKAGILVLFADASESSRGMPAHNKHSVNISWINEKKWMRFTDEILARFTGKRDLFQKEGIGKVSMDIYPDCVLIYD